MLKQLPVAILLLLSFTAKSQLNNQWIDYTKTYYKFRVSKDSLYRLPQATLATAGLGGVSAEQFQLWRNGEQVRLYSTAGTGALGASDYLEFWGKMNDGKPDNQLFRNADFQLADRYSLETDTASYFLTVNPAGNNLRFATQANTVIPGAPLASYHMRNLDFYYRNQINRGFAEVINEYVYSSSYDPGEGWGSNTIAPGFDLTQEMFNLNVYAGGPANGLTVRVTAAGMARNIRTLQLRLFNTELTAAPYGAPISMSFFNYQKVNMPNLPLSLLQNPAYLAMHVQDDCATATDRITVSSLGITYPATFNFNNQRYFSFELPATASGNYLEISNFNHGGTAPVLYDNTSGNRYVGDISTPAIVKFYLPASNEPLRKFTLVSQQGFETINNLQQRNFVNFDNASNQGNYLIISNPFLYNDGTGNNYIDQYRQYRSSSAGGGFNPRIYDINELTDQFAFGITKHPSAIRDFIRYAYSNFSDTPKYAFLIGRGVNYIDAKENEASPLMAQMNLVPTFGWPASDNLLACQPGTFLPLVPVGRLGAVNAAEVDAYLQKVIQYEQAQQSSSPSIIDKAWMKHAMHVIGGKDSSENATFTAYMNGYATIYRDTLLGGKVETFAKSSTGAVQQANSDRIEQLINEGLGFIGYFGHSSANTFEFNLSNPDVYSNQGKYPFFNVSGCSAGNFYIFDPLRLSGNMSISEKYVLANQRGSIGFLADSHFGIPPFLNYYNSALYSLFSRRMYGNTIGNQMKRVVQELDGANPNLNYYMRIHLEEIALHGDPAIRINSPALPDYAIEEQNVRISPSIISVADQNFNIKVKILNIGKAVSDSIVVSIKRRLPNDSIRVLADTLIRGIRYADSLEFNVNINPTQDKGLNQLIIKVDADDTVEELFETNNSLTKEFYIFEDELRPAFPYNFSIVNQQNLTYVANTADALSGERQYVMEIDTTENFNSPYRKTYNKTGPGGIVEFTPTDVTFTDSTVYYWRVAMRPEGNGNLIWNGFSFVYLPASSPGFNQSHYYQHLKSKYTGINLTADRKFKFNELAQNLIIRTGLGPYYDYDDINVSLDVTQLELFGCRYNSLQFYVFDSTTLMPVLNHNVSTPNGVSGLYGSWPICQNGTDTTRAFFEFPYTDPVHRKAAMDFIDLVIQNGQYVAITNLGTTLNTSFIQQWQADAALYGPNNTLYHKLRGIGFTEIDSFYHNLPFLYFYQRGISGYSPRQVMGPYDTTKIEETFTLRSISSEGSIQSATYGPARSWTAMHWRGFGVDSDPQTDSTSIEVWGVRNDGNATQLATVFQARDTTLSFVNAQTYPYLRLVMRNADQVNITPYQLRYLRVNADLVPEGAVAPALLYQMKDTVVQGEVIDFRIAFKNISQSNFDSLLKVKLYIKDRNNVDHLLPVAKRKALVVGDTLALVYPIDTRNFAGKNTLAVDFNPDNDQPEQYHYNNVLFKDFYVVEDRFNPLLDVTFDGVHILNQDIVSTKPQIIIRLKDESRFLALKDTASIKVQIRYPDQTLRSFSFGDTMRFIPANLAEGDNTASIELNPSFINADESEEGTEYELIVSGKDASGNRAGDMEYHVVFKVINKPMISNLFNYPNPFTTSTAFVFTVTGSEIPQMRIQILTITGKVVKEIPRSELGNIHIGNNVTEYKWDGTDMYGQKLANGVYLYRVISSLNGKKTDKFKTTYGNGNNTDNLFKKGYGKMYLMR